MNFRRLDFNDIDFSTELEESTYRKNHRNAKQISINDFNRIDRISGGSPESEWKDNADINIDAKLASRSEAEYIRVAREIVNTSVQQLKLQNSSKNSLKRTLCKFFMIFISLQYAALIAIFGLQIFQVGVPLPNEIITAYICSVFVETLGAIILMIKYAFDSKQETQVLQILNGVITNFQKFNGYNSTTKK